MGYKYVQAHTFCEHLRTWEQNIAQTKWKHMGQYYDCLLK